MRNIILLSILAVTTAAAGEFVEKGWHFEHGIKEAERILEHETKLVEIEKRNKIVGGVIASANAHPHLAGLVIDLVGTTARSACGGTLITAARVLTAGHCWSDGVNQAWRFEVVLGSPYLYFYGLRIYTSQFIIHPNFIAPITNDIALLILPYSVSFTNAIRPIPLPTGNLLLGDLSGTWTVAAGYGKHSDALNPDQYTTVRQVLLQVMTVQACRNIYGAVIQDSNICTSGTGGVGVCGGDSGGPLIANMNGQNYLVGVSSFAAAAGCELGFPSGFARVTTFQSWIEMYM